MPGTQSGGDGEAAGFAGRGSRNRWEAARKPVKARNAPQTKTANELGSVVLCKRDMVKTQRPEDITGAHRATAQAGVTGQPPRALTGALAVTGPAGIVLVRLSRVRTLCFRGVPRVQGNALPLCPIRLHGTRGVTTGGKQLAAEGHNVQGFDIHDMVVPSGNGTKVIPLPHPYLGVLREQVAENVKLDGHGVAYKGSISKHNHPVHNQLPGTIKFNKNPNKEGEVTSGTAPKLKINGKEAAVVGSKVTTCNDNGAKDNSTIMAPGAHIPMPAIANPDAPPAEEKETKHPDFMTLAWQKTTVKEKATVVLTASVKDIADGNGVTFQVWKKGQNPEGGGVPQARIAKRVENGEAKAEFSYKHPAGEPMPDEDPEFFFTAHSAWCPYKKSGEITVELPKLENPAWKDGNGKDTDKGLVGQTLTLAVESKDLADGEPVLFRVFPEGADPEHDKPVAAIQGTNEGGKAEVVWRYEYKHDPEKPLTEKPKYFFTASGHCRGVKSGDVEIAAKLEVVVVNKITGTKKSDYLLYYPDGTEEEGQTNDEGLIEKEDLVPGLYEILVKKEENGDE